MTVGPLLLVSLLLVAACVGLAAGWWWARRWARRAPVSAGDPGSPAPAPTPAHAVEPAGLLVGIADVLEVLPSAGIVLDPSDAVVLCSPSARGRGLVRGADLTHPGLRDIAREVRRDGVIREIEREVPRGPVGEGTMTLGARVARLDDSYVLLLVDDRTRAAQVEAVRRDFVANVSHELKTPVGGIALLAEAVLDAKDDPAAVDRFARRIVIESNRLTKLVKEIVDLSRLQSSDGLVEPTLVSLRSVAEESVEMTSALAEGRNITLALAVEGDPHVYGDAQLLRTALSNLLSNAVNYSPDDTRVVVSVRPRGQTVELAVADQGTGIARADQQRVFERFYRVDAARSRATGGTGLGLAIVKHIATNHGGEVTLWSAPGHGSTFTIRLPLAGEDEPTDAEPTGAEPTGAEPTDADVTPDPQRTPHREEAR